MSVQSQIDRVNGEVNDQKDLIERLKAILSGKVGGIIPSGIKTITENGLHDVSEFSSAQVNVPVGIFPAGTKTITTNGTHDVTNYVSALINVNSLPAGLSKIATGTLKYTSDTSMNSIAHNMGVAPDFYVIFPVSTLNYADHGMGMVLAFGIRRTTTFVNSNSRTANKTLYWADSSGISQYSDNGTNAENVFYTDRFNPVVEVDVVYKANVTYRWIAGKFS